MYHLPQTHCVSKTRVVTTPLFGTSRSWILEPLGWTQVGWFTASSRPTIRPVPCSVRWIQIWWLHQWTVRIPNLMIAAVWATQWGLLVSSRSRCSEQKTTFRTNFLRWRRPIDGLKSATSAGSSLNWSHNPSLDQNDSRGTDIAEMRSGPATDEVKLWFQSKNALSTIAKNLAARLPLLKESQQVVRHYVTLFWPFKMYK